MKRRILRRLFSSHSVPRPFLDSANVAASDLIKSAKPATHSTIHINDLDYDVLYLIFRILANELPLTDCRDYTHNYQRLVKLSSVCRYWRTYFLPYIHETLDVTSTDKHEKTNAKLMLNGGYMSYAKTLRVMIQGKNLVHRDITTVFNRLGISRATWPKIRKLSISYPCASAIKDPSLAARSMAQFFSNHIPSVTDVEYFHTYQYDFQNTGLARNPCGLVTEFVSQHLAHSPQLTHLTICMDQYEGRVLTRISAATLKHLRITCAVCEITWNWFDSGDGDDVWFHSLKSLDIAFEPWYIFRQSYHNGDLSTISQTDFQTDFRSDYRESAKRAHFPKLEALKITPYRFMDSSFYSLFEGCPLTHVNIQTPAKAQYHIPPTMLTNLIGARIAIALDRMQFVTASDTQPAYRSKTEAYSAILSGLLSSPSTAQSVHLTADFTDTFSLPASLAWNSVKLHFAFGIDMQSVHRVLEQMPKLRDLYFRLQARYIEDLCFNDISTSGPSRQQLKVVNTSLQHLGIAIPRPIASPGLCLMYCLKKLLPLVPSLKSLGINRDLVDVARDIVSNPEHGFDWVSKQLEIAPS